MATNGTSRDEEESQAGGDLDECSICHEGYKNIAEKTFLPCAHYFHKDCIDQWLAARDSCPICRRFPREDSFTADVAFTADDVLLEGADAAFEFNPRMVPVQQAQPMHDAQLMHHMQQVETGVHQMQIGYEQISRQWENYIQQCENNRQQWELNIQQMKQQLQLFEQSFFSK